MLYESLETFSKKNLRFIKKKPFTKVKGHAYCQGGWFVLSWWGTVAVFPRTMKRILENSSKLALLFFITKFVDGPKVTGHLLVLLFCQGAYNRGQGIYCPFRIPFFGNTVEQGILSSSRPFPKWPHGTFKFILKRIVLLHLRWTKPQFLYNKQMRGCRTSGSFAKKQVEQGAVHQHQEN